MNYTGRPSISGCRPMLSLYPTHRFCQYLLLIFITFTNSFLFNRAFSTNSRRPLSQRLPLWERSSTSPSLLRNATARVAAPSVCFAAARILLAAAPTAPPCFRHWRRSSPLLLPRGGFGIAENFSSSPEAPLLGELSAKQTERLYEGEPFLCRKVRLLASPVSFWRNVWYNGFAVHPAYLTGEEVDALAYFLTFLVSVGADVVSHFICKWLDRYEENRKA